MEKKTEKEEKYMKELQDRYIRFDWAIKRLLRQKANFGVLEGFLTVFLGEQIKIEEILESEGYQQMADEKFNRVDIKAKNTKGDIILIEIQNTRELYYLERVLYGVAKAVTEHLHLGQDYSGVKKVYSISILYFDIGVGTDYLYHGQNQFVGVHTHDHLQVNTKERGAIVKRLPSEIFPEYILVRVNEFDKVAVTPLEEWVRYLKDGIITSGTTAPGLEEAREKLRYYSMSPEERYAYDEHLNAIMIHDVLSTAKFEGREEGLAEGLAEGREEGLIEGREEGRVEERLETARRMRSDGLSMEMVVRYTGLSEEEINNL